MSRLDGPVVGRGEDIGAGSVWLIQARMVGQRREAEVPFVLDGAETGEDVEGVVWVRVAAEEMI